MILITVKNKVSQGHITATLLWDTDSAPTGKDAREAEENEATALVRYCTYDD